MRSRGPNATGEELEGEPFFTSLLDTKLENSSDNYDTKAAELKRRRRELKRRLKALEGGTRPHSQAGTSRPGEQGNTPPNRMTTTMRYWKLMLLVFLTCLAAAYVESTIYGLAADRHICNIPAPSNVCINPFAMTESTERSLPLEQPYGVMASEPTPFHPQESEEGPAQPEPEPELAGGESAEAQPAAEVKPDLDIVADMLDMLDLVLNEVQEMHDSVIARVEELELEQSTLHATDADPTFEAQQVVRSGAWINDLIEEHIKDPHEELQKPVASDSKSIMSIQGLPHHLVDHVLASMAGSRSPADPTATTPCAESAASQVPPGPPVNTPTAAATPTNDAPTPPPPAAPTSTVSDHQAHRNNLSTLRHQWKTLTSKIERFASTYGHRLYPAADTTAPAPKSDDEARIRRIFASVNTIRPFQDAYGPQEVEEILAILAHEAAALNELMVDVYEVKLRGWEEGPFLPLMVFGAVAMAFIFGFGVSAISNSNR